MSKKFRLPAVHEMIDANQRATAAGVQNVRIGADVFLRGITDQEYLPANVDRRIWG